MKKKFTGVCKYAMFFQRQYCGNIVHLTKRYSEGKRRVIGTLLTLKNLLIYQILFYEMAHI